MIIIYDGANNCPFPHYYAIIMLYVGACDLSRFQLSTEVLAQGTFPLVLLSPCCSGFGQASYPKVDSMYGKGQRQRRLALLVCVYYNTIQCMYSRLLRYLAWLLYNFLPIGSQLVTSSNYKLNQLTS